MEVKIIIGEFTSLENTISTKSSTDEINGQDIEILDSIEGYVRVSKEELAETLALELLYQINEHNNFIPTWDFEYEFSVNDYKFEIKEISKFTENYVYFRVIWIDELTEKFKELIRSEKDV